MAGLIPPQLLEQIRAASDIVDVVGAYLPLKRAGANFVALCPFHKEKSPSFNVSPQRQVFHCFGCHKGGNVFTFVKEFENIGFMEAVRRLAERAHIPLEFEQNPAQQQTRFLKETLFQMHEQIAQRWQMALTNDAAGQRARDYLARREVSPEAVRLFRLGYAPDAWDDTVNWAKSKGYELEVVEQGGLIIRKEGDAGAAPHYYDRFRGRLMFPIADEQGRVIGFSGRVLAGDEKSAKYVNSPETPVFTKGKVMFGLDKSKRAILDAGYAIICEGQLDLIACYMAGVQNIVAPQGTALTGDHCRILRRYVEEVVLCFDSDTAGQNAALRALDDLLGSGLAVRVATVPAPHDPDSLIKAQGGAAFRRLIEQAQGFFDYLLDRLTAVHPVGSDRGRAAIVRGMAESLLKTGNAVLVDTYAQKTAQRLGVSVEAVRAEFRKTRPGSAAHASRSEPEATSATEPVSRPSAHEYSLAKLLLAEDGLVPWVAAHLDVDWVQHPGVRQVVAARLQAEAAGSWQGVAAMLGEVQEAELQQLITEAVADTRGILHAERQIHDVVKALRDQAFRRQRAQLGQQLANPSLTDSEIRGLQRRQHELALAERQPLAPRDRSPSTT